MQDDFGSFSRLIQSLISPGIPNIFISGIPIIKILLRSLKVKLMYTYFEKKNPFWDTLESA